MLHKTLKQLCYSENCFSQTNEYHLKPIDWKYSSLNVENNYRIIKKKTIKIA